MAKEKTLLERVVTMKHKWVECKTCKGSGDVRVTVGTIVFYKECKRCGAKGEVWGD